MNVILVLLVLAAAPVQAAIATALVRDPLAAPVIPVALVAAWAAMRRPHETWPAVLLPAVVLGAASEERVGWFLLALLPAPAITALGTRRFRPRVTALWRRLSVAWASAALAAVLYALVLAVAGGVAAEAPARLGALVATAAYSGALAIAVALCLWPLRAKDRSLFG